jgi:hypothetical protein
MITSAFWVAVSKFRGCRSSRRGQLEGEGPYTCQPELYDQFTWQNEVVQPQGSNAWLAPLTRKQPRKMWTCKCEEPFSTRNIWLHFGPGPESIGRKKHLRYHRKKVKPKEPRLKPHRIRISVRDEWPIYSWAIDRDKLSPNVHTE